LQLRAAEDSTAATAEAPEADSNGVAETPEQLLSPLDRARQALEADEVDRTLMSELFAELEGEMFDLRDQLSASEVAAAKTEALESSLSASKDQLVRLTADFENFRKRTATEKDELSSRAKGDVVASLLPLVDNFELARTQVKAETEGEQKINNSYQGLYKQMVDIMKGLGVDAVDTVGAPFDPELHEAIMREPSDDVPDGTVLMEFRKGFRMGERLLRPAMVKVSFTEAAAEPASAETDSEPNSIEEQ
jgi:molecular chaperone GrpE